MKTRIIIVALAVLCSGLLVFAGEKKVKAKMYNVHYYCDEKGCDGELKSMGVCLTSYPPQYPHQCTKCKKGKPLRCIIRILHTRKLKGTNGKATMNHQLKKYIDRECENQERSQMKANDGKSIYQQALVKWGYSAQLLMAIEECSELIKAICSRFRGRSANVAEEIADVEIMCSQLRAMYGSDAVDKEKKKKLARLKRRLMSTTNGTFSSK